VLVSRSAEQWPAQHKVPADCGKARIVYNDGYNVIWNLSPGAQ